MMYKNRKKNEDRLVRSSKLKTGPGKPNSERPRESRKEIRDRGRSLLPWGPGSSRKPLI